MKPLTLYADEAQLHPNIKDTFEPSIRSVDVEMSHETVKSIMAGLQEYLENVTTGTLRIRFTGRMVQ